jgi:acetyl esterase/lipase
MAADDWFQKRIVYAVAGMDRVGGERDVTYRTVEGADLKMDVYVPAGLSAAERRPVVFFIHGGPVPAGLGAKNLGVFRSYGALAAASGFVGVTFNHRLHAPDDYGRSAEDVAAAVAFVRGAAARFSADAERCALWGFSGGGPLLAPAFREPAPHVKAVVSYYAFIGEPARAVEGGSPPFPPVLVARAGKDDARINASVEAFARAAWSQGVALDVLNHPTGQHGFDILDDDDRSREIIRRTIDFLTERLKP